MYRRVLFAFDFLSPANVKWAREYVLGWDQELTEEGFAALKRDRGEASPAPFCFVGVGVGPAGGLRACQEIYTWYPVKRRDGITVGVAVERIGAVDGFSSADSPSMPNETDACLRPLGRFAANDATGEVISISTTTVTTKRFPGEEMACVTHIRPEGELQTFTFTHCLASQLRRGGGERMTAADFSNSVIMSNSAILRPDKCSECGAHGFSACPCHHPPCPTLHATRSISSVSCNPISTRTSKLPAVESLAGEFAGLMQGLVRPSVEEPLRGGVMPSMRAKVMIMGGTVGDNLATEMQALAVSDFMSSAPPEWPFHCVQKTAWVRTEPNWSEIDEEGITSRIHNKSIGQAVVLGGRVRPEFSISHGVGSRRNIEPDELQQHNARISRRSTALADSFPLPVLVQSETPPPDPQSDVHVLNRIQSKRNGKDGLKGSLALQDNRGPSEDPPSSLLKGKRSTGKSVESSDSPHRGTAPPLPIALKNIVDVEGAEPLAEPKNDCSLISATTRQKERKEKNRLAAQRSNAKRKQYEEDLERNIKEIRKRYAELISRQASLRAENSQLKKTVPVSEPSSSLRPSV